MVNKICGLALLVFSTNCLAAQSIKVMALFKDKAIVTIDGARHKLEVGKTVEGITLVEANSTQAVIKINGETRTLKLGSGTDVFKDEKIGEVIHKDEVGMFHTQASINGNMPVNAVIDTGAVAVAISKKMADELHLDYSSGKQYAVGTANGKVNTHLVNLASIQVGKIKLENVPALVSDSEMQQVLLGMTFLNRVQIFNNSNSITLLAK
jgi:aspartyl protease family protein